MWKVWRGEGGGGGNDGGSALVLALALAIACVLAFGLLGAGSPSGGMFRLRVLSNSGGSGDVDRFLRRFRSCVLFWSACVPWNILFLVYDEALAVVCSIWAKRTFAVVVWFVLSFRRLALLGIVAGGALCVRACVALVMVGASGVALRACGVSVSWYNCAIWAS